MRAKDVMGPVSAFLTPELTLAEAVKTVCDVYDFVTGIFHKSEGSAP